MYMYIFSSTPNDGSSSSGNNLPNTADMAMPFWWYVFGGFNCFTSLISANVGYTYSP